MKLNATLIGKIIKDIRITSGLSTNQFAKEANIPQSALSRIENPPKPDFRVSYDTLVNAVEYAAGLDIVQNHDFDFEQYMELEDAKETISLFVMFAQKDNSYNGYLKQQKNVQASYLDEHIRELSQPVWEVLENHLKYGAINKRIRKKAEELSDVKWGDIDSNFQRYIQSLTSGYASTFDKEETYFILSIKADDKTLENLFRNPSADTASAFAESVLDEMAKKR